MKHKSLLAGRARDLRLEPLEDRRLLSLGLWDFFPTAHSHTAPLDVNVSASYDADLDPATATDETFAVHGAQRGRLLVPPNVLQIGTSTVAMDGAADFFPGELVEAIATTGIEDLSGATAASPYVWRFRTAVTEGSGAFSDTGQILGHASTQSVAIGDLDGDGDLDAFAANSLGDFDTVWLNDGMGRFVDSGQNLANSSSQDVALGDLDGDGDLDAFTVGSPHGRIWINDSQGNFLDSGQAMASVGPGAIALGDLDGDGDLDALVANTPSSKIWLNNGSATFIDSSQAISSEDIRHVALGDLDQDGDLDAFVANSGGTGNSVWLNTAAGIIDSGQSLGTSNSRKIDLGDLDGDGDLDAFVANLNQPERVWLNNGMGTFSDSGQALGTAESRGATLGDVDGDGDLDAFVAVTPAPASQGNFVWLNNGSGTFIDSGHDLGQSLSYHAQLGDVDGDGDLDAFVGNFNANRVWFNDGVDFGDAPDPTYPTLSGHGGASHVIEPGFHLGPAVDAEADGQPEAHARGEQIDGSDDDDGVTFTTELITDQTAGVEVFASAAGLLDAWIDFDRDGNWLAPGDQIFASQILAAGPNNLAFSVPATATLGQTFARFRFSSTGGLTFEDPAGDGEVEDYPVVIQCPPIDFGDAPEPSFPTLAASLGAQHAIVPGFCLGGRVDREPDGRPDPGAWGDDLDSVPDDEDGVEFISTLTPGDTAWIDVRASAAGLLDAWIDFTSDGSWTEPDDQVFAARPLAAGVNRLAISVPPDAELGETFARFRFSSDGGLDFAGFAPDGEVEDYPVQIVQMDFGDAPDLPMTLEVTKWTADDPGGEDFFGSAVCVRGDWAIVGATGDDDTVADSGSAHVFHREVTGWAPSGKLAPSEPELDGQFGRAVSIFGDWAMVGAYEDDGAALDAGSVDVYYFDGTVWSFTQKLTAADSSRRGHFGFSLSLSGEWAVVGAPGDDAVGQDAGAAYVYRFGGSTWDFVEKWTPSSEPTMDRFGSAVSVSATHAIVGAALDDDGGADAGAAYVFALDGLAWTQEAKLVASDAAVGQQLGHSVAISANRAIVGAWLDDEAAVGAGAAYAFHREGTTWVEAQKLVATDTRPYDRFGASVAVSGDRALVGAAGDDDRGDDSGSAYVFQDGGSSWRQMSKLGSFDGAEGDRFGWSVSISGDSAVVGAMGHNEEGRRAAGSAYVFDATWAEPNYPTLHLNNGAQHSGGSGLYLGSGVDIEADARPRDDALGDDASGTPDDEDGVTFTTPVVPGLSATIDVEASGIGLLDAWIDLNRDGDWDDLGERIFTGEGLVPGCNTLDFAVPYTTGATEPGYPTYARFRFSSAGGLSYDGPADDGEVEDHAVDIEEPDLDFGDAPDPDYRTLLASDGARHIVGSGLHLGDQVDAEPDGASHPQALADDLAAEDDEDGVRLTTPLVPGGMAELEVIASAAGRLDGWIDFGRDGSWADPVDHVFVSLQLTAGTNLPQFLVPMTAKPGPTFARFRFSSAGGLSSHGLAADGEVEDHAVHVEGPDIEISDSQGDPADHAIDFGLVEVLGGAQSCQVTITNTSTLVDLNVDDVVLSDALNYQVAFDGDGNRPRVIPAAGSRTVSVTYDPTAIGLHEATLTITSNDPDPGEKTIQVALSGRGEPSLAYGWTRTLGSPGFDAASAMAVDRAGGAYFAGFFEGTVDFDPSPDATDYRVAVGSRDIFVSRLSAEGDVLWTWTAGGSWVDEARDICLDPDGNVYITGEYRSSVDFDAAGTGDSHAAAEYGDVFVTKLAADGGYRWTRTFGGDGNDGGHGIAIDPAGTIHVVGDFEETVDFDPLGPGDQHASNGQNDVFLTELGPNGEYLQTYTVGGLAWDLGRDVAIDPSGNLVLTGLFSLTVDFDPTTGTDEHLSNGLFDVFVTKVDSDGTYGWTRTIGGPGDESIGGLAMDSAGAVHVAGSFQDTVAFDSISRPPPGSGQSGTSQRTSRGGSDVFVTRLNSDGTYGWTHAMGGTSNDSATTLDVGPGDEILVAGTFDGTFDVNPPAPQPALVATATASSFMVALTNQGKLHNLISPRVLPAEVNAIRRESSGIGYAGQFDTAADFDPTAGTDIHYPSGGNDMVFSFPWWSVTEGGEIHGAKWHDLDGNGVRNTSEPPLSDWTIFLDVNGNGLFDTGEASTLTAADGSYRFTELLPGDYRVGEVRQTNWRQTAPAAVFHSVRLEAGEVVEDLDFGNRHQVPAQLGNLVWRDTNRDGLWAPGEPGVAGVTVLLHSRIPGDPIATRSTTTGSLGLYHFADLPAGEYELEFNLPAGYDFTLPNWGLDTKDSDADPKTGRTGSIFLAAGENQSHWYAGLVPSGSLTVIGDLVWDDLNANGIQDRGEPGLPSVEVYLRTDTDTLVDTVVTDAAGGYAFVGVEPGAYYVAVSGGYTATPQDQGGDDQRDSDADAHTGATPSFAVTAGTRDLSWDIGILTRDHGDAPDPGYPTLAEHAGAAHLIVPGFHLGAAVDGEPDGQPTRDARGDDIGRNPDEDGVEFRTALVPGNDAIVTVIASRSGLLSAWVDFAADGGWLEPGDRVFHDQPLSGGQNDLTFFTPETAVPGPTYARFRFSSTAGLEPHGPAPDGEVEDHGVEIGMVAVDFGDAPDPSYRTLEASNGARHKLVAGMHLGALIDAESDGRPRPDAAGDDLTDSADEDGVIFRSPMIPGQELQLTVIASAVGVLDAWIDFGGNGGWDEPADQIFAGESLAAGANDLVVTVPQTAMPGATFARFRFSSDGVPAPDGLATDGEVEDYLLEVESFLDLGAIDFEDQAGLDPGSGDLTYRFETTRAGFATVQADYDPAGGSVELVLYDGSMSRLASSTIGGGREQVHAAAAEGQVFFVRLSGANSDLQLRICNLLQRSGTTVSVWDTASPDTFVFAPGGDYQIIINGVDYEFSDAELDNLTFTATSGDDLAQLTGSPADDDLVLAPNGGKLTGAGYVVTLDGVFKIVAHGGGGGGVATMHDSAGDDTFVSIAGQCVLQNTTFINSVADFPIVNAYASNGGNDTARMEDSPRSDKWKADAHKQWAKMYDGSRSYQVRVKFFDVVHAYAKHGGTDNARFYDTPASEKFKLDVEDDYCKLYGGGFLYRGKFFETAAAWSTRGGTDQLRMLGMPGAKDKFIGTPNKARLFDPIAASYDVTARSFELISVVCTTGDGDVARLYDSWGDDEYIGKPLKSTFVGPGFDITLRRFGDVRVTGGAGRVAEDRARLFDTAFDDLLETSGDSARLSTDGDGDWDLLYEVIAFDRVRAFGTAGGTNKTMEIPPLAFRLDLDGTWLQ